MYSPGSYRGVLKEAVTTQAKTGTLQMCLVFGIRHVWNGAEWEPVAEQQDRRVFVSLSDAAWPYASAKLEALGFNGDFTNPRFAESTQRDGVELACTEDTYEGRTRKRWEIGRWGGGELEQAATEKLRRLNARWSATTGGKGRGGKPAARSRSAPAGASPPPSSPAPASPPRISTRESAWARLVDVWSEKKNESELIKLWYELIKQRGKPENQFTPSDWAEVEAAAQIPF